MKSLKEAYESLKDLFPQSIAIPSSLLSEPGLYISFVGITQAGWQIDLASFRLYLGARSLDKDNFCALAQIDKIRDTLIKNSNLLGVDPVSSIEFVGFNDSLFVYSFEVKFKIYREKE